MLKYLKHVIQVILICLLVVSFGFFAAENTAEIVFNIPFYGELGLPAWVYMLIFFSLGILITGLISQIYMLGMTVKLKLMEKKLKRLSTNGL